MDFITADRARQIANDSSAFIEKHMLLIDAQITQAAQEGMRRYVCYIKNLWIVESVFHNKPKMTYLQSRICQAVQASGFQVQWGGDGVSYIPEWERGNSNSEKVTNYCLIITW
jgi:hypothetical protein